MFEIPQGNSPWFNSQGGEPDYRTLEKTEISYWLSDDKSIKMVLKDHDNKTIWTMSFQGKKGINQYRWDLIVSKQNSTMPYFIHYDKFLKAGAYKMVLTDGKTELEQPFIVKNGISPYKR